MLPWRALAIAGAAFVARAEAIETAGGQRLVLPMPVRAAEVSTGVATLIIGETAYAPGDDATARLALSRTEASADVAILLRRADERAPPRRRSMSRM